MNTIQIRIYAENKKEIELMRRRLQEEIWRITGRRIRVTTPMIVNKIINEKNQ